MSRMLFEECRLEGGPAYMPEHLRKVSVPIDDLKVKIQFYNGWEHFERVDEFTDSGLPIFRWTMSTKVAE